MIPGESAAQEEQGADDIDPEPIPGRCPCDRQVITRAMSTVMVPCEITTTGGPCARCTIECQPARAKEQAS